jgi:ethanolamine utilization protein EutN
MLLAKVVGTVVATQKRAEMVGLKIQIIQPLDPRTGTTVGNLEVVIDAVGAGRGEKVLVTQGSSARIAINKDNCPIDAAIVGIVDQLDVE